MIRLLISSRRDLLKRSLSANLSHIYNVSSLKIIDKKVKVKNEHTTWEEMYKMLLNYKHEFGDCHVPKKIEPCDLKLINQNSIPCSIELPALQAWVKQQRRIYRKFIKRNKMSSGLKNEAMYKSKFKKLHDIGFIFSEHNASWHYRYNQLKYCIKTNIINDESDEYPFCHLLNYHAKLYMWICNQRSAFVRLEQNKKPVGITKERIELLNDINFIWDLHEHIWKKRYQNLVEFFQDHGHSVVPQSIPVLGTWVLEQRKRYKRQQKACHKKNVLSQEQIEKLNKLNFVWDVHEAKWLEFYYRLQRYISKKGTCFVKQSDDYKLYLWVHTQKRIYYDDDQKQEKEMSSHRRELLLDIGLLQ